MNKVILKYKNGDTKEIKTKLSETEKVTEFLKLIGEWDYNIVEIVIVEGIISASCNYQNMDDNM